MMLSKESLDKYGVSAKPASGGCVAPPPAGEPERSDGSGLVGFNKQSDPHSVFVPHSDSQARRIKRMRLVIKGAAIGMQDHLQGRRFRYRAGFGTLTYRNEADWSPDHMRDLMRHYRRWCKRRGEPFRCVWVAELTKRGRLHYHFVFFLRRGLTPPMPDKQGWWPHGSSNVKWARKPVGYIIKYSSKGDVRDVFPKGLRLYGVSGPTGHLGWFRAPKWARDLGSPGDKMLKKNGLWCNYDTGIGLPSPWVYGSSDITGITLKWVGHTPNDICFVHWEEP